MSRTQRVAIAILLCFAAVGSHAANNLPTRLDAGWNTWQVDEANATNAMCCFNWTDGESKRTGCDLDGRNMSFTNSGDCAAAPGKLQVYARINNGQPVEIRVLSSNCPISAKMEVFDLGTVSAQSNLRWFREIIENRGLARKTREDALFALVMSESDAAYVYLDQLLSRR